MVAVMFLIAEVNYQSVQDAFTTSVYSLSDSLMVQLPATQDSTTLLNPLSRQRHVSLVDEQADCEREATRHSSYGTTGQHAK